MNEPCKPEATLPSIETSLPPKTTAEEDLTTLSQRRINLIWERTQSAIALLVVLTTMICGMMGMWSSTQIPTIISVAFGMITGFYFSRTNHTAIGGVGTKKQETYVGR